MKKISYGTKSLNKKSLNLKALSVKALTLLLLCVTNPSYAMTSKQNPSAQSQEKFATDLSEGRDFSVLSFNADGSELMFNECFETKLINKDAKENERECRIFRLNLSTKTLKHYDLPDQNKYFYSDGSFSPKGNFVVIKRKPRIKFDDKLSSQENEDRARQSYEQSEIAVMKADGTDLKIIKIEQGVIARPIMSNDETKIAYFKAKLRKPGSKTFAAQFDIHEIDLKAKTDKLFAGPYQFFETGHMQYLKGDKEILTHAWGPLNDESRGGLSTSKYTDKYSNSSIYKISRGAEGLLEPMVIEGFINIGDPFSGTSGSIYFYGQEVKTGMRLSRRDIDGNIAMWKKPIGEFGDIRQIIIKPNESEVFFKYVFYEPDRFKRTNIRKSGIAYLNTKTSEWKKLEIPSVDSSKIIPVSNSNFIEIKSPNESKNSLKKLPNFTLTNPLNSKK